MEEDKDLGSDEEASSLANPSTEVFDAALSAEPEMGSGGWLWTRPESSVDAILSREVGGGGG